MHNSGNNIYLNKMKLLQSNRQTHVSYQGVWGYYAENTVKEEQNLMKPAPKIFLTLM